MKYLRSSLTELRRLFEQSISIKEIAEPLVSFDSSHDSLDVKRFMMRKQFDIIGVRENGITVGYARLQALSLGKLSAHKIAFEPADEVLDSDPMITVFEKLPDRSCLFVRTLGHIGGIVTRGDLQKTPVRMWIFGLISLLEMQMLRVIRTRFPSNEWSDYLSDNRFEKLKALYEEQRKKNEELALADCLQLADKLFIARKVKSILVSIDLDDGRARKLFPKIVHLRNLVSHTQDILTHNWPDMATVLLGAEEVLRKLESIQT